MVLHHVGIECYRYQAWVPIRLPLYVYQYINISIYLNIFSVECRPFAILYHPPSSLFRPCHHLFDHHPLFQPLDYWPYETSINQLLEMGRDRSNYTSTCTFFLSLKLSLWAVRRKFPGSKIPRGRLSQWAQMYSVNLRMLSSTPHHNP